VQPPFSFFSFSQKKLSPDPTASALNLCGRQSLGLSPKRSGLSRNSSLAPPLSILFSYWFTATLSQPHTVHTSPWSSRVSIASTSPDLRYTRFCLSSLSAGRPIPLSVSFPSLGWRFLGHAIPSAHLLGSKLRTSPGFPSLTSWLVPTGPTR
jgi:hypothetical protein